MSRTDLMRGTLDLLILQALTLEAHHGLGVARRVEQMTQGAFQVNPGSLFPALHRLERKGWLRSEWGVSATNRKAKYYRLTARGRRQLKAETDNWQRVSVAIRARIAGSGRCLMAFLDRLWTPIRHLARTLFRRDQVEHELSQELDGYLEMLVEEKRRAGLSPHEARRAARLEFGGLDAVKDDCRQAWGVRLVDGLTRDLRFCARTLRKAPGFAAVAILTLALGIGGTTAVFSVVNGVLLKPLSFDDADELVSVWNRNSTRDGFFLNLLTSKWVEVQRTGTTCAVSPAHLSSSNNHRLSTLRRLLAAAEQAPQPERGLLGGRRQRQGNTAQGEIPEEPVNQAFTPQIA